MWEGYKNYDHAFTFSQLDDFFNELSEEEIEVRINRRGVQYLNIPASFDIETTSAIIGEKKCATMYIWQFGINGSVIYGRHWEEFEIFIEKVSEFFVLHYISRILIVYVHNLGYEFQFMRHHVPWAKDGAGKESVFAVKERRPLYALSRLGLEFRCSYLLSNYNLAYVGDNLLTKYPVQKMVGDLDYSKARHSLTPLSEKELSYCLNDVRVVMSYIQEKIEIDGNILQIPLTNTGYVRNYTREYCITAGSGKRYIKAHRALMNELKITSEKEYRQLREAFAGGFTHASITHSGKVMEDVGSADLTSSYPYTMVAQKFPMSHSTWVGIPTSEEHFKYCINNFCCLFSVRFKGLYSIFEYDSYISVSHCTLLSKEYIANNGRLVTADECQITITELDWDIISKVYEWEDAEIFGMRIYQKKYLPKNLVMSILNLYKNKTSLKGVEDKEIEYMVSKNMINSVYGMAVTSIVRDENYYANEEWHKEEADMVSQLNGYNRDFNRFLFYAWGVWVTAHARHNLWEAIFEFGEDYVYADTDSIKGINFETHKTFFLDYNFRVRSQLNEMCRFYGIPWNYVMPHTKSGVPKLIGVWEIEESYKKFKTLGAKRYIYEHISGEINMTVSGVNKKTAMPYMLRTFTSEMYNTDDWEEKFKLAYSSDSRLREKSKKAMAEIIELHKNGELPYDEIFENFSERLYIPPKYTGKQTLTYIDTKREFDLVDYCGISFPCRELSSIHMTPASYFFSISKQYTDFIQGYRDASL